MNTLGLLALLAAALALVPCAILCLECLAACLPLRRQRFVLVHAPRIVVLVPAHDEEGCLPEALRSLEEELGEADRIVVVAHNCTDRTAMVARARGAEVVEARDDGKGGKPAALKVGLRYLDAEPPDVVVIVDADCRAEPGAIRALATAAAASGGPVQGDYRFAPTSGDDFSSLSSLALLVKNVVRPLGLTRLGWPCLLNGAGSAYPFAQLRAAPHGEGSIAEDYQLAIDLAKAGHATRFLPEARVRSVLPERNEVALRQRRRWEHGHLALVFRTAPALLLRGVFTRRGVLFCLGVDLLVPPLAFLVLGWAASAGLALASLLLGAGAAAAWTALLAGGLLFVGLAAGLGRFAGRAALLGALRCAPGYVLRKLPLYLGFFGRRETTWKKTERTSSPPRAASDESPHERSETGS
ncbi:MAG: glycosyltransferase [Planctomycetes bacterium]|nr:glycosyltransferase [Planctomycetota bacterium]